MRKGNQIASVFSAAKNLTDEGGNLPTVEKLFISNPGSSVGTIRVALARLKEQGYVAAKGRGRYVWTDMGRSATEYVPEPRETKRRGKRSMSAEDRAAFVTAKQVRADKLTALVEFHTEQARRYGEHLATVRSEIASLSEASVAAE